MPRKRTTKTYLKIQKFQNIKLSYSKILHIISSIIRQLKDFQVLICIIFTLFKALPVDGPVHAGQVPPKEIVAVVRPANFVSSGTPKNLDQRYIVKGNLEMSMEVKFRKEAEDLQDCHHIYSVRVTPSSRKGFHGLYIFPLGCKFPELFRKAGVYMFSFSLVSNTQALL